MNNQLNKQHLINMSLEYQRRIDELVLKLEKLEFEINSEKRVSKEYINSQKTKEQLDIEKNSQLFIRNKIKNHFHPSQLGRKEGKVKILNNLNLNEISKLNNKPKISNDKISLSLLNKKINELRIYARDLKIKNYSTLKKEELIKKISEIIEKNKKKDTNEENEKEEIEITENEFQENEIFYDDDDKNECEIDYE